MWTDIDKPNAGDPTTKAFADAVVDDLTELHGLLGSATLAAAANGSFENDTDNDTYPDSWTFAQLTNGAGALDATDSSHGGQSFKFTRSLGVGNGGGTLTSEDYFEVSPNRNLLIQWQMKCSVTNLRCKVDVKFYTRALALVSTSSVYNSNANPTSWTIKSGIVTPPATAYYAKLVITGGDTSPNVAGNAWFDDVIILAYSYERVHEWEISASGTYVWVAPFTGIVEYSLYGAGGGGGGGTGGGDPGGGGGGGGCCQGLSSVTSGTAYTIVVGNGGAGGGTGVNGTAGTATTFNSISAGGGGGGVSGGAATGGAGGTASGGDFNTDGSAGDTGNFVPSPRTGGNGGRNSNAGWRGGVGSGGVGTAGSYTAAGGAGGGSSGGGSAGGNGKDGAVRLRYATTS